MPLLSRPQKNKNLEVLLHPATVTTIGLLHVYHFTSLVYGSISSMIPMVVTDLESESQQVLPHIAVQKPRAAWRQREVFPWLKDFKIRPKVAELHRTRSEPLISPHQILFGSFLFGMNPPLLSHQPQRFFLVPGDPPDPKRLEPRSVPHGCVRRKGRAKQEPAGEIEGDKHQPGLSQHRFFKH